MGTAAPETPTRRADHRTAWALVGYAVITAAMLWPAVRHFRTRPLLASGDGSFFYWAWWYLPHALAQGQDPSHTDLLFHPVGVDLRLSTTAPLVAILTTPVRVALGPAAQINVVQMAAAWMAAVGAYLLLDRIVVHRGAAFVGGFAFSFSAYRFMHASGHLNFVNTAVLPFGVLLFLRFTDRPSLARAASLGGLLGAAALTDPQIAVLALACMLPVAIRDRRTLWEHLGLVAGAVVVALVVASPVILPILAALHGGEGTPRDGVAAMVFYSSDPTRWLVPPVTHPLFGSLAARVTHDPRPEGVAFVGLTIVALAAVGGVLRVRARAVWVATFALGFVLSLGPYLSGPSGRYDVPLPWLALRHIPPLSMMRVPGRFALVGGLGLIVLATQSLAVLARRNRLWLFGVAGVLAMELLPAYPSSVTSAGRVGAPPAYEVIAADRSSDAVLEIPLQWSTGTEFVGDLVAQRDDGVFLQYATVHGHPLVNGRASRYPDRRLQTLLDVEVYRQVLSLQHDPGFDESAAFSVEDLANLGIGFVVYHRDRPMPDVLRYLRSLRLPVIADDGTVMVFRVL